MVTVYIISDGNIEYKFKTQKTLNEFLITRPDLAEKVRETEEAEHLPVKEVPDKVPLWCLRTVLRSLGLLQTVKDIIAAMPESDLKIAAEEGIEYGNTVLRNKPTTLFIQSVLQLTDAQVDEIFIEADKVEA